MSVDSAAGTTTLDREWAPSTKLRKHINYIITLPRFINRFSESFYTINRLWSSYTNFITKKIINVYVYLKREWRRMRTWSNVYVYLKREWRRMRTWSNVYVYLKREWRRMRTWSNVYVYLKRELRRMRTWNVHWLHKRYHSLPYYIQVCVNRSQTIIKVHAIQKLPHCQKKSSAYSK
jgi:hypothetical protein